jgi:hypothetical protein
MKYEMLPYGLLLLNGALLALNVAFVAWNGSPISVGASVFIGVAILTQLASIMRPRS